MSRTKRGLSVLENVLPPGVFRALRPLLEDDRVVAQSLRPHAELLERVAREREVSPFGLEGLRRRIDALRARRAAG